MTTTGTTGTTTAPRTTWQIDPAHSLVEFAVKHMMFTTVKGHFTGIAGSIVADEAHPENSTVEVTIDATTITTGAPDRDTHLRSADFFDVETYPEIIFRSTKIQAVKGGDEEVYNVTGTLDMHGVTKEITLPVTYLGAVKDPWGNDKAGFETTAKINRKDFGMVWNVALDAGGWILSEDVKVHINLEAQLQK